MVATVALAAALGLLRCTPVRVPLTAGRFLARLPYGRLATPARANVLFAVRWAARALPAHAACPEESVARY
ncbi:hypothetical protein ABT354_35805 [Streptomyces sp. NPDC000594]|uniref:hypothetical protein n=1 Tax=Streptomyces sp. NPDC000594 TaxID=3154261 RepID=UPI00332A1F17